MVYDNITTDFDTCRELLIQGAELTEKYNFPILKAVHEFPVKTISFRDSFGRKIENYEEWNINFFEDDVRFEALWNNPYKYLNHLQKFQSVCMPDFSMSMYAPFPLNIWNAYRNRALSYWMSQNGIAVISNAMIVDELFWDWCWDGLPKHSTLCCCTNGRAVNEEEKLKFSKQFEQMEKVLEPETVIIIGRKIEFLKPRADIIYLDSRVMQLEKSKSIANKNIKNLVSLNRLKRL